MELNGTIFLQIFIFLTLLLWLSKFLFAPILRLFDERERRIIGAKEEAFGLSALADQKKMTFDTEFEKARDSARKTLAHLKQTMEKEQAEMLERAKVKAREKVEKALSDLSEQEHLTRKQLMSESTGIAGDLVNMLLKRSA